MELFYAIIICLIVLALIPKKRQFPVLEKVRRESAQIRMIQIYKEY